MLLLSAMQPIFFHPGNVGRADAPGAAGTTEPSVAGKGLTLRLAGGVE